MKKSKTLVLWVILLAVVLVGAYVGYQYLSAHFSPETPIVSEEPSDVQTPAEETVPKAPDFTVVNGAGETVRLSDYFGKPIVVNFWATWCGPCKQELPAFDDVAQRYGDQVEFLMVNLTDGVQETVEGVQSFLETEGYSFPVYFDTAQQAVRTYPISSVPMTVLIYADGTAAGYWYGAVDTETLEHYVNLLIKGDVHEDQTESG